MSAAKRYPRDTIARTLWGEARGEGARGMRAVCCVIRNRTLNPRWWGRDWVSVCTMRWQFSCWNPDSAARRALLAVRETNREFRIALGIADEVLAGRLEDLTRNSDHFHTTNIRTRPPWSQGRRPVATIGGHHFFRLELRERQDGRR